MAIIQMINDEVLDVQESGDQVHSKVIQAGGGVPIIDLTIIEDQGGGPVWINAAQISSFMG